VTLLGAPSNHKNLILGPRGLVYLLIDVIIFEICTIIFYVNDRKRKGGWIFKKYTLNIFHRKFGAILYGYPGTTQDMDIFPLKTDKWQKLHGVKDLGFNLNEELEGAIIAGKDFIQIRGGPSR